MANRGKGGALDALVNLCKRRGFAFPSAEIYGSIGTAYDLGPLGTQLKKNLQDKWWKDFVERRAECMGLETATILNPKVWEASGHVSNFTDPLSECNSCKRRVRVDKLYDELAGPTAGPSIAAGGGKPTLEAYSNWMISVGVKCPACGATGANGLGAPRDFNLLFTTRVGPLGDSPTTRNHDASTDGCGLAYLRPETAQGVYVQFNNILNASRAKLPFGVAQAGKSFRNEIRTSNFMFRAREFDQWELQYFCMPATSMETLEYWVDFCMKWLLSIGLNPENFRPKVYAKQELAHYALATTDIEYKFPFGWDELWGIANRGDFDLKCHTAGSGVKLKYVDPISKEEVIPHVIEPALGGTRLLLAVLCDALVEETVAGGKDGGGEARTVLKLHEDLAPFKLAVLPLMNKGPLADFASQLHHDLLHDVRCDFDASGSIGKRYRRHDEIGTPFCVTIDHDTLKTNSVTVRCRDSMQQVRVSVEDLKAKKINKHSFGL